MRCSTIPTRLLLTAAILFVGASSVEAQLRPDPGKVKTAETMRAKRASAEEVAAQFQRERTGAAEITAILRAVGYVEREITSAHERALRMDASSSAKAWLEATGDAVLAYRALVELSRSSEEALRLAREELRMDAREALRAKQATGARLTEKNEQERVYAEMKSAGFVTAEIVSAFVEELGSTPTEIYEAMMAEGASLTEIAQQLLIEAGQSVVQVGELFLAKGEAPGDMANALKEVGATGADVLLALFIQLNVTDPNGSPETAERIAVAAEVVGSGEEVVEALWGKVSERTVTVVAFSVDVANHGGVQASATWDAIRQTVQAVVDRGYELTDVVAHLEVIGATREMVASIVYAALGTVDMTWDFLRGEIGWTANQVEDALSEFIPVTIDFLADLVALGGTSEKIREIIGRLRDMGVSAVDIAMEVGADLGIVPMAQALWDAGYGAAEVTSGLVQGMQATANEAAQVVAGLSGGVDFHQEIDS